MSSYSRYTSLMRQWSSSEGCEFMSLVTDPVNSPHTERAKVGGQTMQPSFTLVIG